MIGCLPGRPACTDARSSLPGPPWRRWAASSPGPPAPTWSPTSGRATTSAPDRSRPSGWSRAPSTSTRTRAGSRSRPRPRPGAPCAIRASASWATPGRRTDRPSRSGKAGRGSRTRSRPWPACPSWTCSTSDATGATSRAGRGAWTWPRSGRSPATPPAATACGSPSGSSSRTPSSSRSAWPCPTSSATAFPW